MRALWFYLSLFTFIGCSSGRYISFEEFQTPAEQSALLKTSFEGLLTAETFKDYVHLWSIDPMGGEVVGDIYASFGWRRCETHYLYVDDGIDLKRGSCGELNGDTPVPSEFLYATLKRHNEKDNWCGIMDGWYLLVDIRHQGRNITFIADNPNHCKDADSQHIWNAVERYLKRP